MQRIKCRVNHTRGGVVAARHGAVARRWRRSPLEGGLAEPHPVLGVRDVWLRRRERGEIAQHEPGEGAWLMWRREAHRGHNSSTRLLAFAAQAHREDETRRDEDEDRQ